MYLEWYLLVYLCMTYVSDDKGKSIRLKCKKNEIQH